MNAFKHYQHRLKQELPVLVPLSVVQIWLCFNYLPWVKIESLLGRALPVLASIVTVAFLFYAFLFSEVYGRELNLEFLDDLPCPEQSKIAFKVLMQAIFHTIMLYAWYVDFHRCTNTWYAVWYTHCIASFWLLCMGVKKIN